MLDVINYLHNNVRICHRDIKPENIFIDEKYNLKFGDFGFATSIDGEDKSGYLHDYKGTLAYMPPEYNILKTYTGKANDLFASAIVVFMMVTQCQPFNKAVPDDLYYKLIILNHSKTFWKFFEKELADFSPEFKDLMFKMLQLEPHKRLNLEQIVAHPWINGNHLSNYEVINYMAYHKTATSVTNPTGSVNDDDFVLE